MKRFLQILVLVLAFSANGQILELNPTNFPVTQPCGFTELNNKLFYVGANSTYGREMFSTDGTLAGNQLVQDIGNQFNFAGANGFLIQSSEAADGKIAKFNGKLYFEANNEFQQNNFKLWSTDGTSVGTQNIAPNIVYGPIRYFKEFNGRLYFTALGSTTGNEVYLTDGTTAGTSLLKDINPNGQSVNINNIGLDPHFTVFNNRLYFIANDGVHGNEIWSTDGTTAGTTILKDINPGIAGNPASSKDAFYVGLNAEQYQPFVVYNNRMYFNAYSYNSVFSTTGQDSLYSTDGTASGTIQLQIPMPPNPTNDFTVNFIRNVKGLTIANNKLYVFGKSAKDSSGSGIFYGQGIYQTDGTSVNTTLIKSFVTMAGINGFSEDNLKGSMREFSGEYYFLASEILTSSKLELWKLNPLTNIFNKIVPIQNNTDSAFTNDLFISQVFNNKLYFIQNAVNPGIYSTDGTISGTSLASRGTIVNSSINIVASTQVITKFPDQLKAVGNSLYFAASFDTSPLGLWRIRNTNLSNSDNLISKINLYPNPTSSQINLTFSNNLENANLKIVSLLGQTVLEKQNLAGNNVSFDVSNLAKGMYVVTINDGGLVSNTKFVKE